MNDGCDFSCHGCITDKHPKDYHLKTNEYNLASDLNNCEKVFEKIHGLSVKRVTWLGKEPTCDPLFPPLAKSFKKIFNSYNILITNAYEHPGEVIDWLDEICVSIKAVTPSIFTEFTGRKNPEIVTGNLYEFATRKHISLRAESVLVPRLIEANEIASVASKIAEVSNNLTYRIDGYIPFGPDDVSRKPSQAEMMKAKYSAELFLNNVSLLHNNTKPSQTVEIIY